MDFNNNLILIQNEDKTDQIDSCDFQNGKWHVKFRNNNKCYTYSKLSLVMYINPRLLDPANCIVYVDEKPVSGIHAIHDFGKYTRLVFKSGYKKAYISSQLIIEMSCLSNNEAANCFRYLETLANQVSIKPDYGSLSFLSKQYNSLTAISPRSALAMYLERKTNIQETGKTHAIFPFGFNASQKLATERAIAGQISLIEGPPGTGKTQTILNIIANAVLYNKTVAVVSNNNSATANVLEKLQKYGLDFIAAYLGNRENKDIFFAGQTGRYPDMKSWLLSEHENHSIKSNLIELLKKLNKMLVIKNKSARLKQELTMLRTEFKYYDEYYTNNNFKQLYVGSIFKLNSDKIMKILIKYKDVSQKGENPLSQKIYNFLVHGIYKSELYKFDSENVVSFLQRKYYDLKIAELEKEIKVITGKLASYNFDATMAEFSEKSMRLFKSNLAVRYGQLGDRKVFTSDVLLKNTNEFIKEYPVVLSTTHSLRNNVAENYLFDYVLIDEASQVDIVTGALALSCAKNAVIVGDTKQLPNVITTEVREKANRIYDTYTLHPGYNYTEQSLLSSIVTLYEQIPRTLLKEHYRCHPKIIGFCNQKFYNNELIVLTEDKDIKNPLILYQTAKGNHARGTFNQRQIDVVFNEILPDQEIDVQEQSLGIITPYRQQANEFQKKIGKQNIEADTVHKYQGREKDIIILSTVSNEITYNDFGDNPNLINVAVSRAVDQLIIVTAEGSDNWHGTNVGDLIKYIKYNNFETIESQIYSVFDLLYKSYSKQLFEVKKRYKKVSEYDSENLMNIVVKNVLEQEEFRTLDYILHQPLRMLIKNTDKLSDDEINYAMNILTHTDFVIFNRLDKMPVLIVEVDGHAFHENNSKQLERDRMKDRILEKYDIPIIRMKTTGSEEAAVLRDKLIELRVGTTNGDSTPSASYSNNSDSVQTVSIQQREVP